MRITVFGASGQVGSRVVAEAKRRGHSVRAFVYTTVDYVPPDGVEVVRGDAASIADVQKAIDSTDVVISALGSWHTKTKDIQTRAFQAIVPALEQSGVVRIVSITGAEAHARMDKISLKERCSHAFFSLAAGKILRDGESHLHLLEASNLEWTVVRSPAMKSTDGREYAITSKRPSLIATIPRDSVAKCMVDIAESQRYIKQAPFICNT